MLNFARNLARYNELQALPKLPPTSHPSFVGMEKIETKTNEKRRIIQIGHLFQYLL